MQAEVRRMSLFWFSVPIRVSLMRNRHVSQRVVIGIVMGVYPLFVFDGLGLGWLRVVVIWCLANWSLLSWC